MGFLDNLFKKETRKIISGVVDSMVDNVMDNVKDSLRGTRSDKTESAFPSVQETAPRAGREGTTGDDADCCYDKEIVRERIEKIAAEDWPGYELRRDISAEEFGADTGARSFEYGLYLDGQPKVMIMILNQYQHRNQSVQCAHKACKDRGIGSFHLLLHLPNRRTYIAERIKSVMP